MTDKQIIIDGVDVSGCEYFRETLPTGCLGEYRCNCDSINTMSLNCEENNCIYKQLKAKEQECKRLMETCKEMNEVIRTETTRCSLVNSLNEQLDQLKAENEILKEKLIISSNSDKKTFKIIQTLTEIKEIANDFYLDGEYCKVESLALEILQKISEVTDG